jgi:hypothetical protein
MKSDSWLSEKIINESLNKHDISYVRRLMQQGKTDEEVLSSLRKKMFSNSKGMRAYIRHEKIRALMVKLSCKVHWVYLLPVMKGWIREKEVLIRWRESNHSEKIGQKARELKGVLIDNNYNKMKCDCATGRDLPDKVMDQIEKAAEELLLKIEEEEGNGLRKVKEIDESLMQNKPVARQPRVRGKESPHRESAAVVMHARG